MGATQSQPKRNMFAVQQERPANPVFGAQGAGAGSSSLRLHGNSLHRASRKDGNFNFLGHEDEVLAGDENRNQLRLRLQSSQGRELFLPATHLGSGLLSPLSRLPSWSPLEPLPEVEVGEDGCGRWAESDSEFDFSYRSSSSSSSLSLEAREDPGKAGLATKWERVCVGGTAGGATEEAPQRVAVSRRRGSAGDGQSPAESKRREEGRLDEDLSSDSDSDSDADADADADPDADPDPCADLPELMEAVWTLQDWEKFKAQEMERHQVQLTMYRRLALIRWVRSLQGRVQEQQNRLQSSFDVILTHRKELLRMGVSVAPPTAAVSQ
ncbi:UPF0500 protein C1orf216-like [Scleropages formosus]|uniref:UPF0500 protein C1orf216-like n=1 Tax=Scleropages formosus TaxID=113540 RepID=A0A0P7YT58_SCLFO|nr:UPF0500 protein C1orf216-like [Scleropages formosus]